MDEQDQKAQEEASGAAGAAKERLSGIKLDDEQFKKYSLEKIARLEAEMQRIGDRREKRYQTLRKRVNAQKQRMQMKLGKSA